VVRRAGLAPTIPISRTAILKEGPNQARSRVVTRDRESEHGISRKERSSFPRNRIRIGCETVCGEPQDWTSCHTIGISNRPGGALGCEADRTSRNSGADVRALVPGSSRGFLGCVIKKRFSFFVRKELEQP
jgi:hypothetical protein